jgi:hypothetical protein
MIIAAPVIYPILAQYLGDLNSAPASKRYGYNLANNLLFCLSSL